MATYCMMGGLINLRSLGKATLFRTFPHLTNQHIKTSTATLRLLKTAAHVTETREQERKSRAMVTDELLLLFYEFQRRQGGAISIQSYYKIHLNIFDFIFAPSKRETPRVQTARVRVCLSPSSEERDYLCCFLRVSFRNILTASK